MKTIITLFILLLFSTVHSQPAKDRFYLFDKDWNDVKDINKASYFMQVIAEKDSAYICRYYTKEGPMVKQESYKDESLTVPHGLFCWYDEQGRADSMGYVNVRRKDRTWSYFDDTLGLYLSVDYNKGKEVERRDYVKKKIITPEGERDMTKKVKDTSATDSTKDEREASFAGGRKGYTKYLEKNLEVPERTKNLRKKGVVRFRFVIDKEGNVKDIEIMRSLEWAADAEVLRVIGHMPAWTPAYQNGRNVIYQAMQTITFNVEER